VPDEAKIIRETLRRIAREELGERIAENERKSAELDAKLLKLDRIFRESRRKGFVKRAKRGL
jgi:hypothetical protein